MGILQYYDAESKPVDKNLGFQGFAELTSAVIQFAIQLYWWHIFSISWHLLKQKTAHYWAAREGNAQSRIITVSIYVENRQNGGRNTLRALRVPFPLQWGRFLRGGDGEQI